MPNSSINKTCPATCSPKPGRRGKLVERSGVRDLSRFTTQELQALFKNARLVSRSPVADIRVFPTTREYGRILIVTPKKIGNAPKRNLVRRRIKAIFYEEQLYRFCYDSIFFCKKESTTLSFSELKALMHTTFCSLASHA